MSKKPTLVDIDYTVWEAYQDFLALNRISEHDLPGRLSIKIRRLKRDLKPHAVDFEEERSKVLEEDAISVGPKKYKLDDDGDILWRNEDGEKRLDDVGEMELSLKVAPLFYSDFDKDSITVKESDLAVLEEHGMLMESLPALVEDKEEEESDG